MSNTDYTALLDHLLVVLSRFLRRQASIGELRRAFRAVQMAKTA